jgi:hypothetical protein
MSIPQNILFEHLIKAIEKIDIEGIPRDAESRYYDVVYNGKNYPPKVIVSFANLFANGEILGRDKFEGGLNTPCFKLLEENGFKIVEKAEVRKYSFGFQNENDSPFKENAEYSKKDIYNLLDVPLEKQRGAWDTGYREYGGDIFIFANVGVPGRTGHDYDNHWKQQDFICMEKRDLISISP